MTKALTRRGIATVLTILVGQFATIDAKVFNRKDIKPPNNNNGQNVEVLSSAQDVPTSYLLQVDGVVWFEGRVPSNVQGKALQLHNYKTTKDSDEWGHFSKSSWEWTFEKSQEVLLVTDFRIYDDTELAIFTQTWPQGYNNNNLGDDLDDNDDAFLASFPSWNATSSRKQDLYYLGWGLCFASHTMSDVWDSKSSSSSLPTLNGITSGTPLLWHDEWGRSVMMSPMDNFFVSGQALNASTKSPSWLDCGIRKTVKELPAGFSHSTLVVAGHGINNTMTKWGDVLLTIGGKKRTDPYDDFVLSHLGYWTDNGAYYYHLDDIPQFENEQQALEAVKADLLKRNIPVRYFQWDDWWMESKGDVPGITSWTPYPNVFPSGFTDWLGQPLSLYAPMYAKNNSWSTDYKWKTDDSSQSAIPVDERFYKDLFANGTSIGMKMFEQDFFCTTNTDTGLTNTDVHSGMFWTKSMDEAAAATGVTLQWCMMNACHALQSTLVHTMTNGRATDDNCRGDPRNIESMGQNGLFFYSLGFFPSRDNVWTTGPDTVQEGCGRYCVETNAAADNAVALLSGGPYGPSDAVGFTNYNVVMRAVRKDGVLLKPSWPLSSLDVTFLKRGSHGQLPLVWAAHDDFAGIGRWSYIVGINLVEPFSLTPIDLLQTQQYTENNVDAVAWPVDLNTGKTDSLKVMRISSSQPLTVPACPPLDYGPGSTLWATAPILANGMVLLGDVSKWATMSKRRFQNIQITSDGIVSCAVLGAPDETVAVSYVLPNSKDDIAESITCNFSNSNCGPKDKHGDVDCELTLTCTTKGCTCTKQVVVEDETTLLRAKS